MSSQLWSELEQESYNPEDFVERLAWRVTTNNNSGENFDAPALNDAFVDAIKDLNLMLEKQRKKCTSIEQKCHEEEAAHRKTVAVLMERNRTTATTYRSLDEKINSVATKVVHLGDQLESVNTPRSRAVEALRLMQHIEEFVDGETSTSPLFTDNTRLHEAAGVVQRLQLTAQDLPAGFDEARRRIDAKYSEIESKLITEFVKSHRSADRSRMRDLAALLAGFKSYSVCVDAFIEQQVELKSTSSASSSSSTSDAIFKETVPLCEASWKVVDEVFPNPHQVMAKLVLNIYHGRLKAHVDGRLADKTSATYLTNLFQLYSSTTRLSADLARLNFVGSDHLYLSNLTKTLFRIHLESYINVESRHLNDRCAAILRRYYDDKGHHKKANVTGGLTELRRDLQGFIASRANISIADPAAVSYGGETFLSEEVAIRILQLSKESFRRVQVLSQPKDVASNAMEVFAILISYLLHEHVDYALDVGLAGIPGSEPKTMPELFFFDVVGQTNAIVHLLEKQFSDSLVPLVASTPRHADCLTRKKTELEALEKKVDAGLDRSLVAVVGWVRAVLAAEQKKADFNPPTAASAATLTTPACTRVVKFVSYLVERVLCSLDGKNVETVLYELGVRLHRAIYEHLQQFAYSSAGVMAVICDVQEYRKCVAEWKVPSVNALFDTLHAMCNLLILPPENLRGAAQGDQLANLDKTIIDNWIQLRTDYKTQKLSAYL